MEDKILISKKNLEESLREISHVRVDLDMLYHQLKERETTYNGLEAANSIILAKAWLGEIFALLGLETPYKPATEVKDIPKTQDTSLFIRKTNEDRLKYLNDCREEIANILSKTGNWSCQDDGIMWFTNIAVSKIIEAKFHLGFELGILRDTAEKENKADNTAFAFTRDSYYVITINDEEESKLLKSETTTYEFCGSILYSIIKDSLRINANLTPDSFEALKKWKEASPETVVRVYKDVNFAGDFDLNRMGRFDVCSNTVFNKYQ